jgi:hypothetical protein
MSRMFSTNRVRQALVVFAAVLLLIGAVNSLSVPIT